MAGFRKVPIKKSRRGMEVFSVDLHDLDDNEIDLVVLNWKLLPKKRLEAFLKQARSITCADGGYNRLVEALGGQEEYQKTINALGLKRKVRVVGDMDSIQLSGSLSEASKAVDDFSPTLIRVCDESTNDFEKVVSFLREEYGSIAHGTIVVDGAFGGRLDHMSVTLGALYQNPDLKIYLVGEQSICCLLKAGKVRVDICNHVCTRVCGLLPFLPVASVKSQGLKWEIEEKEMKFDGLISSSNEVLHWGVDLDLSDPIVWFSVLA